LSFLRLSYFYSSELIAMPTPASLLGLPDDYTPQVCCSSDLSTFAIIAVCLKADQGSSSATM
jgi:hypothetical protein